jgi:hypothetical protein
VWIDSLLVPKVLKKLNPMHSVTMNPRMNFSNQCYHAIQLNTEQLTWVNRCSSSAVSTPAAVSGSIGVSIPLLVVPVALHPVACGVSLIRPSKPETLVPASLLTLKSLGGVMFRWPICISVAAVTPVEEAPAVALRPSPTAVDKTCAELQPAPIAPAWFASPSF